MDAAGQRPRRIDGEQVRIAVDQADLQGFGVLGQGCKADSLGFLVGGFAGPLFFRGDFRLGWRRLLGRLCGWLGGGFCRQMQGFSGSVWHRQGQFLGLV
ncbi:MAG: hypothetical protein ACJ8AI_14285 [Rhodopila sp.]